jgi:tellurite resistance protein TehA-like permease
MSHDILISCFIFLGLIGFGIFGFNRQLGKNRDLRPRRIPWIFLAMAAFATAFMVLVHIVNLLGFETGTR